MHLFLQCFGKTYFTGLGRRGKKMRKRGILVLICCSAFDKEVVVVWGLKFVLAFLAQVCKEQAV